MWTRINEGVSGFGLPTKMSSSQGGANGSHFLFSAPSTSLSKDIKYQSLQALAQNQYFTSSKHTYMQLMMPSLVCKAQSQWLSYSQLIMHGNM